MQGIAASRPQRVGLQGKGLILRRNASVSDLFHGRNYERTLLSDQGLCFSMACEGRFYAQKGPFCAGRKCEARQEKKSPRTPCRVPGHVLRDWSHADDQFL